MYYKELTLKASMPEHIQTEIMYEIAAARVDKKELLRINLKNEDQALAKNYQMLLRILKKMKAEGRIQFFATEESFANHETEAVFLLNKYPERFALAEHSSLEFNFIYIRI